MQKCNVCQEVKPFEFFYKQTGTKTGFRPECKQCISIKREKYREDNQEKIKEYYLSHLSEKSQRAKVYQKNSKVRKLDSIRAKTRRLIKKGELTCTPCEVCGEKKVHAHHDDYNKPREVRFLCGRCHAKWHRENVAVMPASFLKNKK